MSEFAILPEIGTPEFWDLYDEFVCNLEFPELSHGAPSELSLKIQEILRAGHMNIVRLPRPEKGWHFPKAWLVLRDEQVISSDGSRVFMWLQTGDVMLREDGWDRDVFVTHSPILEMVSGQMLGQQWPMAKKGLFLPLYDKATIMKAVRLKVQWNAIQCLDRAEEVERDWHWY